ncbi:golgi uridine diphosphate-N- acetylglucosamine transporter [Coniosporium tulheliwenetii]|uniref:Golgi uridine diphosphate-N- acetylglucosamine transporter n=1 Tax=Coniosporium tulheliwenetii TaxID=3383036 RepID=A0ACC2ZLH7_9PEZI|nr:golgi uridine diphosphate-N- acetylglucosamine transporter [Cladosporium sp. JES 115]
MSALAPVGIVALIFGGCCSNVFALEAIVKREPDSGLLITLTQFILTTLSCLPSQLNPSGRLFLKKPAVPFHKWALSAAMFFAVNMLNNWAFAFDISVPVHIILRSFGSVSTMGKSMSTSNLDLTSPSFEAGLLVLLLAQLLSAYMGVYVQEIYEAHGKHWHENLFYSHFLSLPLFLPLSGTLQRQYHRLTLSPPLQVPSSIAASLPTTLQKTLASTPTSVAMLMLNTVTQLLCISGVNLLSANTSAVTVTIVLNVRKLVSFMFSIWLFGNKLSGQMLFGAALVFGAGALYGWETSVGIKRREGDRRVERVQMGR